VPSRRFFWLTVLKVPVHSQLVGPVAFEPVVRQHITVGKYGGANLLTSWPGRKERKKERKKERERERKKERRKIESPMT
jgi:hypothetical protein